MPLYGADIFGVAVYALGAVFWTQTTLCSVVHFRSAAAFIQFSPPARLAAWLWLPAASSPGACLSRRAEWNLMIALTFP